MKSKGSRWRTTGSSFDKRVRIISRAFVVSSGIFLVVVVIPSSLPHANRSGSAASRTQPTWILTATVELPTGEVGAAYTTRLETDSGVTSGTWTLTSGTLPSGLTLSSQGVISGTPTTVETSQFTVTESTDTSSPRTLSLTVTPGPSITTGSLASVTVGKDYLVDLDATNGTSPYTWSIAAGPLPGGIVLSSTGVLSGRPETPGTTEIDLKVTDALGSVATATLPLTVLPAPPPPEEIAIASLKGVALLNNGAPPVTVVPSLPVVGVALEPSGKGGWAVASNGTVTPFGSASLLGSERAEGTRSRIVGIASNPGGTGYWLVSSSGHVETFGSARPFGSVPKRNLSGTIVGIAARPGGSGYWLVSSTGRIYRFGDAIARGTPSLRHRKGKVIGIAAQPRGGGYWVAMSTGTVFSEGGTSSVRSATRTSVGTVAIAPAPSGAGYFLVTRSGRVITVGSARAIGSFATTTASGAITGASAGS